MLIALLATLFLRGGPAMDHAGLVEQFAAMRDRLAQIVVDESRREQCETALGAVDTSIETAAVAAEAQANAILDAIAARSTDRGALEAMIDAAEAERTANRSEVFARREALRMTLSDDEWRALVPKPDAAK
jgi:hypothetical protein